MPGCCLDSFSFKSLLENPHVLVGFLLGGRAVADLPAGAALLEQVPVRLRERVLPGLPVPGRELGEPLEDTEGRRRPKVPGRPGDLL